MRVVRVLHHGTVRRVRIVGIPRLPGFRFLNIGGVAPANVRVRHRIAARSVLRRIPVRDDVPTRIYNDCSQVPAEQIVDHHSCTSDHADGVHEALELLPAFLRVTRGP
jgi:hypothetical protein